MIGQVIERNESLFPVITIDVLDRNSQPRRIHAVIDTGFTGEVLLPPRIIQMIKPELHDDIMVEIADGNIVSTNTYLGTISWHGRHRRVRIIEADGIPLIGMRLLRGSALNIQTVAGGSVRINKMPQD